MNKLYNIIAFAMVGLMGLTAVSCSDDDLDTNPYNKSGVNLLAFGPSPILRTHEIRITGTNMNAVSEVIFPGAEPVTTFNNRDAENIYVDVPDASVPGQIRLVAGRDTVVSEGTLTFEEPIEVTGVTPVKGLNAGDIITITGDYVYNIASVTFTEGVTVLAEDFVKNSRRELQVRVPLAAVSGKISFSDGAEWNEEYETPLEILGAKVTSLSASEGDFGSKVTIKGNNLQTIETVMFAGGVQAEFTLVDNNTIEAVVPADAKSGAITLLAFSGESVTGPEFNVPTIAIEAVSRSTDLVAGDEVKLTVKELARVKEVWLPGATEALKSDQYTIEGNVLTVTIPEGMGDGDLKLVQNANISVTTPLEVRKLEGVIWQGKEKLEGWNGSWGIFNWDGDKWEKFRANFIVDGQFRAGQLTIHFRQTKDGVAFNAKQGDWGTSFLHPSITPEADGVFKPAAGVEDLVVDLTVDEVKSMFGDGGKGIVVWGDGIELQYVKFVASGAEYTLWDAGYTYGAEWDNGPGYLSDAGTELVASGYGVGSKIRLYVEAADNSWQLKVVEGHWGPTYLAVAGVGNEEMTEYDLAANNNIISFDLTQEIWDAAMQQQWWGNTFIISGVNFTLKKITIAPL